MRRDLRDRNEKGKVKFRVIDFELEGSDESVQESLRSIVSALNRSSSSVPVRSLPSATTQNRSQPTDPPSPQGELFAEDAKIEVGSEEDNSTQDQPTASKSSRSSAPRKFYSPKVLTDLDLNAGKVSFKDFCAQKSPAVDSKKYLVIMAWLKASLGLEEIGADHIYTCYRTMGWSPPKDIGATLRALKKQAWVVSGDEKGTFKINHIGQDVVDRMPKE